MAWGTRINDMLDNIGKTLQEGAGLEEAKAKELGMKNSVGARVFNSIKDTMFTGEDATLKSQVVGTALGVGAVVGTGAALQNAQDHPVIATGAVIGVGALLASNPANVMSAVAKAGERLSTMGNLPHATQVTEGEIIGSPVKSKGKTPLGTA